MLICGASNWSIVGWKGACRGLGLHAFSLDLGKLYLLLHRLLTAIIFWTFSCPPQNATGEACWGEVCKQSIIAPKCPEVNGQLFKEIVLETNLGLQEVRGPTQGKKQTELQICLYSTNHPTRDSPYFFLSQHFIPTGFARDNMVSGHYQVGSALTADFMPQK